MLVVSPHLDDAVFSCSAVIAENPGTVIVTVFAGLPAPGTPASYFDRAFATGENAVSARRAEDQDAAAELGATVIHLDGLDSPYTRDEPQREWVAPLADLLTGLAPGTRVLAPLGLRHPDHLLASWATLTTPGVAEIWLYEELPYRVLWPEFNDIAWARTRGAGYRPALTETYAPPPVKETAAGHYSSQLGSTDRCVLTADERVHRLERIP